MANLSAGRPDHGNFSLLSQTKTNTNTDRDHSARKIWLLLAGVILLSALTSAQNAPQVSGVDPATGKVNDTVTVSGDNLGKASVSAVYLSDDKNDFKATIVDQADDKIQVKVPQVKPGPYNISIQVGDKLFIKPVKFTVEG
jgi:IPT/TIG domain